MKPSPIISEMPLRCPECDGAGWLAHPNPQKLTDSRACWRCGATGWACRLNADGARAQPITRTEAEIEAHAMRCAARPILFEHRQTGRRFRPGETVHIRGAAYRVHDAQARDEKPAGFLLSLWNPKTGRVFYDIDPDHLDPKGGE